MIKPIVNFIDLGVLDYGACWDLQQRIFDNMVQAKIARAKNPNSHFEPLPNYLFFVEHPPVFTLGKSGSASNLLINNEQLEKIGATFYKTNRGGDITHHGPGQLVAYPVFDLEQFFTDIGKYMRTLEEAVIRVLAKHDLHAERYQGYTGVWLDVDLPKKTRKICAMGVRTSRWVSMHGLALNVCNDLKFFDYIIPCGIEDKQITSISKEALKPISIETVKIQLLSELSLLFGFEIVKKSLETIKPIELV